MNHETVKSIHWSFWLISIVMLIWNVLGAVNFFVQLNPAMLANYAESERMIIEGRPVWATAGFALAVFAGAIGCVFLLLKKPFSLYLFYASLFGVFIVMIHSLSLDIAYGMGEVVGIILMPICISVFLIWYSKYSLGKGWLTH